MPIMRKLLSEILSSPSWQPLAMGPLAHVVTEHDRRRAILDARAELAFELYGNALRNVHEEDPQEDAATA